MNNARFVSTRTALVLVVAAVLGGCASTAVSTKQVSLDRGALQPNDQVARLAVHVHQQFKDMPGYYHWWADLISVDGKRVPSRGVAVVQVPPGRHALEYACHFRFYVTAGQAKAKKRGRRMFNLAAGSLYYLVVEGHQDNVVWEEGVPVASGSCDVQSLSTTDPAVPAP